MPWAKNWAVFLTNCRVTLGVSSLSWMRVLRADRLRRRCGFDSEYSRARIDSEVWYGARPLKQLRLFVDTLWSAKLMTYLKLTHTIKYSDEIGSSGHLLSIYLFCSTSLPLNKDRWFDQHIQAFHTQRSAVDQSQQHHEWISSEKFLGTPRFEPWAAGWESRMLPLCYVAPG